MSGTSSHTDDRPEARGHETRDLHATNVLATGAGLFGVIAFALLLAWGAYALSRASSANPSAHPSTFTHPEVLPPEPRLQEDPHLDLMKLRAAEDSVLGSYGWVNKDSGIVRIPIARAMQLLVSRGLPLRKGAAIQTKE